jgi:DNA-binding GntR family transcriptional regulator
MTALSRSRTTLSEHAYDTLRAMIVRGEMAPAQRLSEPELTERLAIGRTPLREAVLRLAQDGLVAIYPQSGSFVTPISLTQLEEAQFVRERLECGIVRRVAERADPAALAGLRSLLQRQQQAADEGDAERFHHLDEELHETFCAIAGWPDVWRLIHRSKVHLDRVRRMSLPLAGQMPHLILQHRAILDAVIAGDADGAEAAMRGHLREVFSTVSLLRLDRPAADPSPETSETGAPMIRATAAGPI